MRSQKNNGRENIHMKYSGYSFETLYILKDLLQCELDKIQEKIQEMEREYREEQEKHR